MNILKTTKCIALVLMASVSTICAAEYPEKPITFIVPFATGGIADLFARSIAQKVTEQTGKPIVVESKLGAGGRIGYAAGAKAAPDGYTFVITDVTYTMLPALYSKLPWDHASLVPVSLIAQMPYIIAVNADAKLPSLPHVIALAKANPGKMNFGSAGVGSVNQVVTAFFNQLAGIEMTHIPYRGMSEAMVGLLGGSVDLIITAMPTAMAQVRGGKVVAVGVSGPTRSAVLPNVPTASESGVPFVASIWIGLTAPKGTPQTALDWMQKQVSIALSNPDVRQQVAKVGAEARPTTSEEFAKLFRDDTLRWGDVIRSAKIVADE